MSYIVKVIPAPAGTNSSSVMYIPALASTVVDLNSTQTLTNKTFTNAVMSGSGTTLTNATITGGTIANATVTNATLTGANTTISNATVNGATVTNSTISANTNQYITVYTIAATGGNIATANTGMLSRWPSFALVTAANGTNGIQLPTGVAGAKVTVHNSPAANAAVKLYPQVNCQINEAGSNTALTIAANSSCELTAYNTTHWYSNPKVPS